MHCRVNTISTRLRRCLTVPGASLSTSPLGAVGVHKEVAALSRDALGGAELTLLDANRLELSTCYRNAFKGGARAVMTTINLAWPHLDAHSLYSDSSRDNDLTYYIPGKGMTLQEDQKIKSGRRFCIPREMVSSIEKEQFSVFLAQLAMRAAISAKDGDEDLQVGLTCHWYGRELGFAQAQLAIEQHFLAAAAEGVDFLAVERADDEAALDAIAEVLEKNLPRMVPRRGIINSSTDKEARPGGYLGKTYEDGEEEVGFKIPTYLVGDSSAQSWNAVCKAADGQQLVTGTIAVAK